jgi:hypothetical protein
MFETVPMSIYGSVMGLLIALAAMSKPFPPVDAITGLDSYVEKPSIEVATNPSSWNAVWQRHRGITPIGDVNHLSFPSLEQAPTVNFDQNEVLVIFGGLAAQGGYDVVDSVETAKAVIVRIEALPLLNSGVGVGSRTTLRANPYAFFMFKRTNLPFKVQMSETDQNGNAVWKTVGEAGGSKPVQSGQ